MTAFHRLLAPGEGRPVLRAALACFLLWCGYAMLRPVRDSFAGLRGETNLLWTGTFFAALLAVPLYGRLAARATPRHTVTVTYRCLTAVLIVFWILFREMEPGGAARLWTERGFYIFVSIYNLFAISLIWSLASEVFRSEQGKRVFGLVSAGISLGAASGSAITAFLSSHVGIPPLVLIAAATLECTLRIARGMIPEERARSFSSEMTRSEPWWRGLQALFADRYMRTVTIYLLLFLVGSGFLYFLKTSLARIEHPDASSRIGFLAHVDLITNSSTLILQVFVTGRLLPRFGVGVTLGIVPLITFMGFGAVAMAPALLTVAGFEVLRRISEYAMSKPAREVLFTVAGSRARFQSKPLMDTLIYRGGDMVVGHGYEGLAAVGVGPSGAALVVLPFAAAGLGMALLLGRMHGARQQDS